MHFFMRQPFHPFVFLQPEFLPFLFSTPFKRYPPIFLMCLPSFIKKKSPGRGSIPIIPPGCATGIPHVIKLAEKSQKFWYFTSVFQLTPCLSERWNAEMVVELSQLIKNQLDAMNRTKEWGCKSSRIYNELVFPYAECNEILKLNPIITKGIQKPIVKKIFLLLSCWLEIRISHLFAEFLGKISSNFL